MTLYMQCADGAGVLQEIEVPAYAEGGQTAGVDQLGDRSILRLSTAAGEARVLLPPEYSPDWQIVGWRRE